MSDQGDSDHSDIVIENSSNSLTWDMTDSDYARVIFCDVADSYSTDVDVECHYQLSSLIYPQEDDYVGVYRIGWKESVEHVALLFCSEATYSHDTCVAHGTLLFKADMLPKEDGQYYQFCYMTKNGEIHGASIPFSFHTPKQLITSADGEDSSFVVIRSHQGFLEEKLRKTTQVMKSEHQTKVELEEKVKKLESDATVMKNQKTVLQNQIKVIETEKAALETELKDIQEKYNNQQQQTEDLKKLVNKLQSDLEKGNVYCSQVQDTVKTLISEKTELEGKLNREKKAMTELECHVKSIQLKSGQVSDLENRLMEKIMTMKCMETTNNSLIDEISRLKKDKDRLKKQQEKSKDELQFVQQQLDSTKTMLEAQETTKDLMWEEIRALREYKKQSGDMIEKIKHENASLKKSLDAFNLQLSNYNMGSCPGKVLEFSSDDKGNKFDEIEYAFQVADLQARLRAAAVEYQTKYQECWKLQRHVEKLKKKLKDKCDVNETSKSSNENMSTDDKNSDSSEEPSGVKVSTCQSVAKLIRSYHSDNSAKLYSKKKLVKSNNKDQFTKPSDTHLELLASYSFGKPLKSGSDADTGESLPAEKFPSESVLTVKQTNEAKQKSFSKQDHQMEDKKTDPEIQEGSEQKTVIVEQPKSAAVGMIKMPSHLGWILPTSTTQLSFSKLWPVQQLQKVIPSSQPQCCPRLSNSYGATEFSGQQFASPQCDPCVSTSNSLLDDSGLCGLPSPLEPEKLQHSKSAVKETVKNGYSKAKCDVNKTVKNNQNFIDDVIQNQFREFIKSEASCLPNSKEQEKNIICVPCPVCQISVGGKLDTTDLLMTHLLEEHQQRMCPVCGQMFHTSLPLDYLQFHIQDHFQQEDLNHDKV
ncbi:tax1-binding protein 1 homolog isoform X2 [Tachypleus tridentatus]|uniref:tax1-binding protein 1 homolog isoform X2 n=1 Tax=Tachypleus tridentatus TaxID=6853 RepID=UPI003FD07DF0